MLAPSEEGSQARIPPFIGSRRSRVGGEGVNEQEGRKAEWDLGWVMPAFDTPTPQMPRKSLSIGDMLSLLIHQTLINSLHARHGAGRTDRRPGLPKGPQAPSSLPLSLLYGTDATSDRYLSKLSLGFGGRLNQTPHVRELLVLRQAWALALTRQAPDTTSGNLQMEKEKREFSRPQPALWPERPPVFPPLGNSPVLVPIPSWQTHLFLRSPSSPSQYAPPCTAPTSRPRDLCLPTGPGDSEQW